MLLSFCDNGSLSLAQLPQIRLSSVHPPGAQQGTTTEIEIAAGTNLDEVDTLLFSHPGIHAVQKQTASGEPVPNRFLVSIDAVVPPGVVDVRVHGLFGVSNPRRFRIDTQPEVGEIEPNNQADSAMDVLPGTVVNGRSHAAGDRDVYRLVPAADGRLVFRAEAAVFGSLMQPVMELADADGRILATSRRIFTQDAVLVHDAVAGNPLRLTIRDVVYAGGSDYQYRLVVDQRPLIEFAHQHSSDLSEAIAAQIFGRHLPDGEPSAFRIADQPVRQRSVTIPPQLTGVASDAPPFGASGLRFVPWTTPGGVIIPLVHSTQPVVPESADGPTTLAQVPAVVSGAFETIDDHDEVRFVATKGERLVVEVFSDRIGSIADPVIIVEQVLPAEGEGEESFRRIAVEDDARQNPGGNNLPTVSSDPSYLFTAPDDGTFRVRLLDRYAPSRGDPRLRWYLSLAPAEPDFELVVFDAIPHPDPKQPAAPGAVSLRRGGSYSLPVCVWRSPDCTGPIRIALAESNPGLHAPATVIPAGQTAGQLVLTADEQLDPGVIPGVRVIGTSAVGDREIRRSARIATLVHDAVNGLPRTARITDALTVGIMKDAQPFSVTLPIEDLVVSQNQQILLPVTVTRRAGFEDKVDITLSGLPGNVDAPAVAVPKGQTDALVPVNVKNNAGVMQTTLVASASGTVPYRRNPWLEERARDDLKQAEAALADRKQELEAQQTALNSARDAATAAQENLKAVQAEIVELQTRTEELSDAFRSAQADVAKSAQTIAAQQARLADLRVAPDLAQDEIAATLDAVTQASQANDQATQRVRELAAKLTELTDSLTALRKTLLSDQTRLPELQEQIARRQTAVTTAENAVTAATEAVKAFEEQRARLEDAANKAAEGTKPANINVRTLSPPVRLTVLPAIGSLNVQVPEDGRIVQGGTLAVKVQVTRQNNFAGALTLTLEQPSDATGLSAEPQTVAAGETEATLTVVASADAPPAAPEHLRIRATGEVSEPVGEAGTQTQACDAPVKITIVENAQ